MGGLERYTVKLSNLLLAADHEVHVFGHTFEGPSSISFHPVPMLKPGSPVKNISFAHFCKKRIRQSEFSVVHSMERLFKQDIYRVSDGINPHLIRQRYRQPLVRLYKSFTPRRLALSFLERKIFQENGCRAIMTNSTLLKSHIRHYYNVPSSKITVIYNGVDTVRFNQKVRIHHRRTMRDQLSYSDKDIVLLFISNNFKLKGLSSILQAMHTLDHPRFKLLIVGDDHPKPFYKLINRLGLVDRIQFAGPQRHTEKFYACADIFVLPTKYDAFANVCLEAMACGLPVVTTKSNGAADIMEHGKTGLILHQCTPDCLADQLSVLEASTNRTEMGKFASQIAKQYTWENHLKNVLNLYRTVQK
jgi:UDP-glucose:(heptosyl)LPS alpha-1,3-glucosyltransferase